MMVPWTHPSTGTITFLFTDLEGSTRLWEQFPDAMQPALSRHDAILRGAIEASGGTVVKTTGDGMMAVFGGAIGAATASLDGPARADRRALGRDRPTPRAHGHPLRRGGACEATTTSARP